MAVDFILGVMKRCVGYVLMNGGGSDGGER
jgi:hypothetical protein